VSEETAQLLEVLEDGTVIDVRTGEVVDPNDADLMTALATLPVPAAVAEKWEVQDEDGAEWALDLLSKVDAEIAVLKARRSAVLDRFDAQIRQAEARRNWWHLRFAHALTRYAKRTLSKGKTRLFENGKVSFRQSTGRREITDPALALAFVQRWAPDTLRVEYKPVRLADIEAAIEKAVEATEDEVYRSPSFVHVEGPKENVTIETGITKAIESMKGRGK